MILTRRHALSGGGSLLAASFWRPSIVLAAGIVDITMQGKPDGSDVWFDPIGIHVQPGQSIRWTNRNPGNSHTTTAYHPAIMERPLRIPEGAAPWDSDYLLPDESFSVTLTVEGVYDYYCTPHEHAGMVGRIVVGMPPAGFEFVPPGAGIAELPEIALGNFPSVEEILAKGAVHRE